MHTYYIHITYAYTHAHKAYKQLLFRYKYISLMKLHIRLTSFEIIIKSRSVYFTDIKNEIQFLICG